MRSCGPCLRAFARRWTSRVSTLSMRWWSEHDPKVLFGRELIGTRGFRANRDGGYGTIAPMGG